MTDYISPVALEFLSDIGVFEKTSMIRRTSDLNTRVADSGPNLILPKNAMLHMLDNISHSDQSTDTFDIAEYPFLNSRNNLKYLHHFTDFEAFDKNDLAKISYRIYRPKLFETLKQYGMTHRKMMIPTLKLDAVLDNKNCIIIENYNPLYRLIVTNNRPISHYNRYRAFLSVVLKNTMNYNRQHFLVIRVPDQFTYTRSNIMAIVNAPEISSQKLISNNHFYFFIIDLVALLLNNNSTISTLNVINKRQLSSLNIMLIDKNKSIIFNIGKLATLAKSKTYVFGFIDNISRISGVDVPVTYIPDGEVDPNIAEPEENVDDTSQSKSMYQSIKKNVAPSDVVSNIVQKTTDIAKQKTSVTPQNDATRIGIQVDEKQEETPEEIAVSEQDKVEDEIQLQIETPQQKPLSDKQQQRIQALSQKHRSIKVSTPQGAQTIGEILDTPVTIDVQQQSIASVNTVDVDPSLIQSTTVVFDKEYHEKLLRKDILSSVVAFKENGLFVTDYVEKNEYNSFTRVKHIRVSFVDINGKKHTVNFKLPMPDDEGYYLVNGVRLSMSKQLINVPICKISPTRVSLISNYNKTLVDKITSTRHSLPEYLNTQAEKAGIKLVPKKNTYIGVDVPSDYKQLGATYSKIITNRFTLYFEYPLRYEFFHAEDIEPVEWQQLEDRYGILLGASNSDKDVFLFINKTNKCSAVNVVSRNIIETSYVVDYFDNISVPSEWCNLKILDKNIPIIFILAYRYGLSTVLHNLRVKYRFISKEDRKTDVLKNTEISIRFADGSLVFDRYPLEHSYILSGLDHFSTLERYNHLDFDGKDIYYKLLSDKGMSTNYLRGIDNYFSFFIDPITKEVLQEMNEPTNTRDLLIRAVDMLVNETDKVPSALSNFRLRGAERLPAMIYNEIARQYANYVNSNYKDVSFSINTEAIFQRLIQDQTMGLREDINPIHAIKEVNKVTYAGFGGRSSEAFVAKDRKYPEDAVGIISETTTDSGSVGMVAALTANPKIKNLRGMFDVDKQDMNVGNMMNDTSLLMPGATHDDAKRLITWSH